MTVCIGQTAHECREQAQAAQIELLTYLLVEQRMLNDLLQKQHLDDAVVCATWG